MERWEAVQIIKLICWKYEVPECPLVWDTSRKASAGFYRFQDKSITVGPHCWRGTLPALLHELAHHVTYCKKGMVFAKYRQIHHGKDFQGMLIHITGFWYGDWTKYPWDSEYKRIANAYGNRKR